MKQISIRNSSKNDEPPPFYRSVEMLITVRLHYGGAYVHSPIPSYIGGSISVLDNVRSDYMSLDGARILCDFVGLFGVVEFYFKTEMGFQVIESDRQLKKFSLSKMMNQNVREMSIYVDCQGVGEIQVNSLGPDYFMDVDAVKDDGPGEGLDVNNGGVGYESDPCEQFNDNEYDMNSDTDRGIYVECGNDKLVDVNIGDEGNDVELEKEVHSVDENASEDGISARDNATRRGKAVVDQEYESGEENVVESGEELIILHGSDSENEGRRFPTFDKSQVWDPKFQLGMRFSGKQMLREAVHSHAVKTMRDLIIIKNDKRRLYAKCRGKNCEWRLNAVRIDGGGGAFHICHYNDEHMCSRIKRVKSATSSYVSKRFGKWFKSDPNRYVKAAMQDVNEETNMQVSIQTMYREKYKSLNSLFGDTKYQYSRLWDFIDEVKRSNPGSTLVMGIDNENKFDCFYMCLGAVKEGFISGCRRVIGVDGCHLKGPCGGVLLTAVGIDPNNCLYPIAWAVVEKEDGANWNWFLSILQDDLNIEKFHEWTFMSDKQKGLLQAFQRVFPGADHRFYVRHLHGNFKRAGFTGDPLKEALWKAARASTVNEWESSMIEMAALNEGARRWFDDKPPQQWSKSHFNPKTKCDILLNNGCESFNSCILEARDKPILTMLEWIMEYVMKRHQKNRDRARRSWRKRLLCPKIYQLIDNAMKHGEPCYPIKSDDTNYQVKCVGNRQFWVDLKNEMCGCRKWDVSDIPCVHAWSAIDAQRLRLENLVDRCYSVDKYLQAYNPTIMPINGRSEWKKSSYVPPLPPNDGRAVGRPETARRKEPDEPVVKKKRKCRGKAVDVASSNPKNLTRQHRTVKCKYCGEKGHNKKGCLVRKQADQKEGAASQNEGIHHDVENEGTQHTEVEMLSQLDLESFSQFPLEEYHQSVFRRVENVAAVKPTHQKLPVRRQNVGTSHNRGRGKSSINAVFKPPSRNPSLSCNIPLPTPFPSPSPTPTLLPAPSIVTQLQNGQQGKRNINSTKVINMLGGTFAIHGDRQSHNAMQAMKGKKKK